MDLKYQNLSPEEINKERKIVLIMMTSILILVK